MKPILGQSYAKRNRPKQCPGFLTCLLQTEGSLSLDQSNILQTTKRTGWVLRKVEGPESISDHMYMASLMAWLITDPTVNRERYLLLLEGSSSTGVLKWHLCMTWQKVLLEI